MVDFNVPPTFAPNTTAVKTPQMPQAPAPQAAPAAPQAPVAPQAAPVAPVAPQAAPQAEPAPVEKKKKKKHTVMISEDHIKFVMQNIKTMAYADMAEKLGITKNQVNRILQTMKGGVDNKGNFFGLRGNALEQAAKSGEAAYGLKENGKPDYSQPLTELAQKIEAKIAEKLSRPAESRPGGGGGNGGKVKQALDSQLDSLLADL